MSDTVKTAIDLDIGSAPPKPGLVLRVGVTGHRLNKLPEDTKPLEGVLTGVLKAIQETLEAVYRENESVFQPLAAGETKGRIRIISALAEGADQMVALAGGRLGADLQCILPFAEEAYAKDFESDLALQAFRGFLDGASAVFELDGSRETPEEADLAYRTAGIITLRQSDIVIAVWDGATANGPGGTADIVAQASSAGIPVIWISPDGQSIRLIPVKESRNALAERLSASAVDLDPPYERIRQEVRRLTVPPQPAAEAGVTEESPTGGEAYDRLRDFYQETERLDLPRYWGTLNRWFMKLFGDRHKEPDKTLAPYAETTQTEWSAYFQETEKQGLGVPAGVAENLQKRFAWADNLAVYLSEAYRSSFILLYLLSALAVFVAVVGVLTPSWVKPFLVAVELAIILYILLLIRKGRKERWHERFLDYRQLAEHLRHLRVLALTGSRTADTNVQPLGLDVRPGPRWVNWYYRASVREMSLPNRPTLDRLPNRIAQVGMASEIDGQIRYHETNAERMHNIHDALEWIGTGLFMLTIAVCIAYFGHWIGQSLGLFTGFKKFDEALVTFFGAVLPAFGVAARAIRIHGEYQETAERSEATARQLKDIKHGLEDAARRGDLADVARHLEDACQIMSDEVSVWRFVHRRKHLELPE